MSETERAAYYHNNGYKWPPQHATWGWPPRIAQETQAYSESRDQIEGWIRGSLNDYKIRFDEWCQLIQSRLMPSFTPHGFHVFNFSALKPALWQELRHNYEVNVHDPNRFERLQFEASGDAHKPNGASKFYHQEQLNARLLDSMRPELERWSNISLTNSQAYGVRVYRNSSTLVLHVDKPQTHVISCIVHIGHDLDETWPLQIEDHDGRWHEISLEVGQGLMYESSKQYHARLQPMVGRHYGSVFLHWHPTADNWNWTMWDTHVAVPPDFAGPGSRAQIYEMGQPPFLRRYEEYWREHGMAQQPLHLGIAQPVQSFEKDPGLQERGAPVESMRQAVKDSALRDAAKDGDLQAAKRLLAAGAQPNSADENGWASMHEAARDGSVKMVELLFKHGARLGEATRTGDSPRWISISYHGTDHAVSRFFADHDAPLAHLGDEL